MQGGGRRDANINHAILQPQPNAAILWQSTLGNIEVGHDLETAHDGRRQLGRWCRGRLQHSINAITHPHAVGEVFEVHIARTRFERFEDEQIHQTHHRCLVGKMHQIVERQLARSRCARLSGKASDNPRAVLDDCAYSLRTALRTALSG